MDEEGSPGALRTPRASQLAGDEQSPASTKDYGEDACIGAPPTTDGLAEPGAEPEEGPSEETTQPEAGQWAEAVRKRAGQQYKIPKKAQASLAQSLIEGNITGSGMTITGSGL